MQHHTNFPCHLTCQSKGGGQTLKLVVCSTISFNSYYTFLPGEIPLKIKEKRLISNDTWETHLLTYVLGLYVLIAMWTWRMYVHMYLHGALLIIRPNEVDGSLCLWFHWMVYPCLCSSYKHMCVFVSVTVALFVPVVVNISLFSTVLPYHKWSICEGCVCIYIRLYSCPCGYRRLVLGDKCGTT